MLRFSSIVHRALFQRGLVVAAVIALVVSIGARLGTPLMWNDEAETVVYAKRILEVGYPKVHHGKNVLYVYDTPDLMKGYNAPADAYVNSGWAQFYFAVPAVLFAQHVDGFYAKTAILRAPFALVGIIALAVFALVLWQCMPRPRQLSIVAAFFALCSLCVPLVLHLREVRYYSLATLCIAVLLLVITRRHILQLMTQRMYIWLTVGVLFILFHTFYPLYLAVVALLGLYALRHVRTSWRSVFAEWIPLGVSFVTVTPFVLFMHTFTTSGALNQRFGFSVTEYFRNVGTILIDFSRNGLFFAWIACKTFTALLWRERAAQDQPQLGTAVRFSRLCTLLFVVTIACVSGSFILHQRYYIMLVPVVFVSFFLDAMVMLALFRANRALSSPQRIARVVGVVLSIMVVGNLFVAYPFLRGHVQEIRTPYKGPLDFAIPYIAEHFDHPENITIATNYEEHAFMYYLGSHVIIGQVQNNLAQDLRVQPDVIVPRMLWYDESRQYMTSYLSKAVYDPVTFPVRDYYVNNIPELRHRIFSHLFVTPLPKPGEALRILVRKP